MKCTQEWHETNFDIFQEEGDEWQSFKGKKPAYRHQAPRGHISRQQLNSHKIKTTERQKREKKRKKEKTKKIRLTERQRKKGKRKKEKTNEKERMKTESTR